MNKEKEEEEENDDSEEKEEEEDEKEEENQNKKCTLEVHKEINASIYCYECKIYMCSNCEKHHLQLFKNHHIFNLEQEKENKK